MGTVRAPRTLAEDLRARSEESLVRLLQARPDLAVPPPADLGTLAARAASRAGVRHVLDHLDTAHLQVLEVLGVLDEPCTVAAVTRTWGAPAGPLIDDLRDLALVWGTPRSLHLLRTVADLLGPHPAGLGPRLVDALDRRSPQRLAGLLDDLGLPAQPDPPRAAAALAAHLGAPAVLDTLLAQAPAGTRDLLGRLVWGPPVGAVADADRQVRRAEVADTAASPVDWLLAHGILAVADPGHVVLPREIGLTLRGGRVHREPAPAPPPPATVDVDAARLAASAAHAAAEAVRLVDDLARTWSQSPPGVLRSGGVGVRDLRRTAVSLDVEPRLICLLTEVALAAGLIADDGEVEPVWAPTPAYDSWAELGVGDRWAWLAQAWVDCPAASHLAGSRDAKDGVVAPGSPAARRPGLAVLRRTVLADLTGACPAGRAPRAGLDGARDAVRARLAWARPRRFGAEVAALADAVLEEATLLGVLAGGAPAPAVREALRLGAPAPLLPASFEGADEPGRADSEDAAWDAAAEAVDAVLPPPVDHLLLQADLTAIAPGPLVAGLQQAMDALADVDSRGGATVYRFSASSLRRGLDAGMTADEILRLLRTHSRTGVPQPLEYLVTDAARRHGAVRVGAASAVVRTDDTAALDELLADRRAARLRLRRLAPTVACSPSPPEEVLDVLRSIGLAPAAEGPGGDLLVPRVRGHRATAGGSGPVDRHASGHRSPPRPSAEALRHMIRAVRVAEDVASRQARTATSSRRGAVDSPAEPPDDAITDPQGLVATLRLAADRRSAVRAWTVEGDGRGGVRVLEPLTVDGGLLTALDRAIGRVRSYPVHRIRAVAPVR